MTQFSSGKKNNSLVVAFNTIIFSFLLSPFSFLLSPFSFFTTSIAKAVKNAEVVDTIIIVL
ncbi:MAG: hypothetical protein AB8V53_00790 [Arsenophonus endosymbiont of Dermacentor nuttalli]